MKISIPGASALVCSIGSMRIEVDLIDGSVLRRGERYGTPAPLNLSLLACIKGVELWLVNYANKQKSRNSAFDLLAHNLCLTGRRLHARTCK